MDVAELGLEPTAARVESVRQRAKRLGWAGLADRSGPETVHTRRRAGRLMGMVIDHSTIWLVHRGESLVAVHQPA